MSELTTQLVLKNFLVLWVEKSYISDPGAVRLCLQVALGYGSAALPMNRPVATTLPSERTGAAPEHRKSCPFCHQVQAGPLRKDQRPRALNPDAGD